MPCMCSRVVYMRVCIFVVVVLCLVLSLASTRSLSVNYLNCIAYQFKLSTTSFFPIVFLPVNPFISISVVVSLHMFVLLLLFLLLLLLML